VTKHKDEDFATNALRVVEQAIGGKLADGGEHRNAPRAVAAGSKGGRKGGTARAKALTPEQRSEIAKKAAKSRWNRKND
jgi:hypothetical protein